MADSISIEETNRIRVAIGLKPLPVPGGSNSGPIFKAAGPQDDDEDKGSTLESRQGAAYDNWKTLQDEASAKATRQVKNEAVKKARDAARRFAKLEGKGLGEVESENEDLDTRTWLARQKKRQRKVEQARRLEKELAEREQANTADYTAKDLAGVKVAHEIDAFEEGGGEQILTLKDTTIEENEEEGDELENVDLKERERLTEKLELKKKKPVYDPNDQDDGEERSILAQYDEEIEGSKKKGKKRFTLDGQGMTAEEREAMKEEASGRLKAKPISLDVPSKSFQLLALRFAFHQEPASCNVRTAGLVLWIVTTGHC